MSLKGRIPQHQVVDCTGRLETNLGMGFPIILGTSMKLQCQLVGGQGLETPWIPSMPIDTRITLLFHAFWEAEIRSPENPPSRNLWSPENPPSRNFRSPENPTSRSVNREISTVIFPDLEPPGHKYPENSYRKNSMPSAGIEPMSTSRNLWPCPILPQCLAPEGGREEGGRSPLTLTWLGHKTRHCHAPLE